MLLSEQFERTRSVYDAQAGLEVLKKATSAASDPQYRSDSLRLLARICRQRYELLGEVNYIQQAYDCAVSALVLAGGSERVPYVFAELGLAEVDRFHYTKNADDLDAGVGHLREAVRGAVHFGHESEVPYFVGNLNTALRCRLDIQDSLNDLKAIEESERLLVEHLPAHSPKLAHSWLRLGLTRLNLIDRDPDAVSPFRVSDALRHACTLAFGLRDFRIMLLAAQRWGEWAAKRRDWYEAIEAYRIGLGAIEDAVEGSVLYREKESWLRSAGDVTIGLAEAWALRGDPDKAVEALERGRTMIHVEALHRHDPDLERLVALGHEDLYQRYRTLILFTDGVSFGGLSPIAEPREPWAEHLSEVMQKSGLELQEIISAIRRLDGFEDFGKPISAKEVVDLAQDTPMLYLVAGHKQGVALLFRKASAPEVVLLPDLQIQSVDSWVQRMLTPHSESDALQVWASAVHALTLWLGRALYAPLRERLRDCREVVLIPTGRLALLPLAAAHIEEADVFWLDEMTIRSAPSAASLRYASRGPAQRQPEPLLAVAEPEPVSQVPLRYARTEAERAARSFQEHTLLTGEDAYPARVQEEMCRVGTLHLACHAVANPFSPLESYLILAHDDRLTVRDLMLARAGQARLAVLSACESGLGGAAVPDEVIGFPTALLQTGVAGVIAPLWPVSDRMAALLMARFYQSWRQKGSSPAEALRDAQKWLRVSTNAEQRLAFPDLVPEPKLSPSSLEIWRGRRSGASPIYWGAFVYFGN
jgi:CHAT domain-containing protein